MLRIFLFTIILSTASDSWSSNLLGGGGNGTVPPPPGDATGNVASIVNFDQIKKREGGVTPLTDLKGTLLKLEDKMSYQSFYNKFLQEKKTFLNDDSHSFYEVSRLREIIEVNDGSSLSDEDKQARNMVAMFLLMTSHRELGYERMLKGSLLPRNRSDFMSLFYRFDQPSQDGSSQTQSQDAHSANPLNELQYTGTNHLASNCVPYSFSTFEGYRLKPFVGIAKYNFSSKNLDAINLSNPMDCLSKFYGVESTRENPLSLGDLFISHTGWSKSHFDRGLAAVLNDRDFMGTLWGITYFSQAQDPLVEAKIDKMRLLEIMKREAPSQYSVFTDVWQQRYGSSAILSEPLHSDNDQLHSQVNINRLKVKEIVERLISANGENAVNTVLETIGVKVDENGVITCLDSSISGPSALSTGGTPINELCYKPTP